MAALAVGEPAGAWPGDCLTSSEGMVAGISGVQMGPGATAFEGWYAWMDVVLMMAEPGRRCGTDALHSQNIA